ncbi:MAG: hypothetical protein GY711_18180 [bacterium]|nr:hypothetical protein [bacterium]
MEQSKRKNKLIQPGIQLKMTMTFVGLSALAFTLQFVLFTNALSSLTAELPNDGPLLMTRINPILIRVISVSFALFLPLTFMVGVLTTFKIAGPLYRIELFLTELRDGKRPGDVRLRKNDELQHIAALLNDATRSMRESDQPAEPAPSESEVDSLVPEGAQQPASDSPQESPRA